MRIFLSKEYSKSNKLILLITSHKRLIDYSILFLIILPNLIWILLDKSIWVSDTSLYGLHAIRIYHALVQDNANWWHEMLSIPDKPPILPWIGQFFVPVGKLIGNIDSGLLLITFIAQYVTLAFIYQVLMEYFKKRALALVGCMVIASAPVFIGISKQFYVQSIQLAAVTWFVYIMAYAKRWDSIYVILQLLAASTFAMLIMMSSPIFCIVPVVLSLQQVIKKGKAGFDFRKKHVFILIIALVLLIPALSWYFKNFSTAIEYSSWAYNYIYSGIFDDSFLRKLAVWLYFFLKGFLLPHTLVFVLAMFFGAFLNYFKERSNCDAFLALMFFLQILLVFIVFVLAAGQESRYVLPLLSYFALLVCWSLFQINKRWLTSLVLIIFMSQFVLVNLNAFGLINLKYENLRPLKRSQDRNFELIEVIAQVTSNDSAKKVLLATGGLGFYNLQVEFYTSKSPEYFKEYFAGNRQDYDCVEFMLTRAGVDGDLESAWKQILVYKPDYIVIAEQEIRHSQLQLGEELEHGWGIIIKGTVEISEKVAKSNFFKKVALPEYPEIEFYKYVGKENAI